jgi:hypothetical protein
MLEYLLTSPLQTSVTNRMGDILRRCEESQQAVINYSQTLYPSRLPWPVLAVRCTEFIRDGYDDPRDDMFYSCIWYALCADGREVVLDTERVGLIGPTSESLAPRVRKYLL